MRIVRTLHRVISTLSIGALTRLEVPWTVRIAGVGGQTFNPVTAGPNDQLIFRGESERIGSGRFSHFRVVTPDAALGWLMLDFRQLSSRFDLTNTRPVRETGV